MFFSGTNRNCDYSCGWAELWEVLHHTQCWIPHEMEGIVHATDHLNYFHKNLISRTNVSNFKMVAMPCIWDQMIPWYGHQTSISTTWKVSTSGICELYSPSSYSKIIHFSDFLYLSKIQNYFKWLLIKSNCREVLKKTSHLSLRPNGSQVDLSYNLEAEIEVIALFCCIFTFLL